MGGSTTQCRVQSALATFQAKPLFWPLLRNSVCTVQLLSHLYPGSSVLFLISLISFITLISPNHPTFPSSIHLYTTPNSQPPALDLSAAILILYMLHSHYKPAATERDGYYQAAYKTHFPFQTRPYPTLVGIRMIKKSKTAIKLSRPMQAIE
jgi:hypothetical protein